MLMVGLGLTPEPARAASLEPDAAKANAFLEPSPNAVALLTNTPPLQNSNVPAAGKAVKGVESRPKEDFQLKLQTNAPPEYGNASHDYGNLIGLHSHVRWMFNAGGGHIAGGPHDGNVVLFQTRVGVDF